MVTITSAGDAQTNESQHTSPCINLPVSQTMLGRDTSPVTIPNYSIISLGLLADDVT